MLSLEFSSRRLCVLAMPLLALGACQRDQLAPDCFLVDESTGVCLVPDPGGTAPGINCGTMPNGAVGATYEFTPEVGGGSGNFSMWEASNLPPGLSIDPNSGTISGVPTSADVYNGIEISMFDSGKGEAFSAMCGALTINEQLSPRRVVNEPNSCIPHTASREQMLALLDGGDGSEITCAPLKTTDPNSSCPHGDGNGRIAPGISFDAASCTHSGSIAGDRRGTWVWMVEVTQSGFTTAVPFCATNDVDTFHDIAITANGEPQSDLQPGLYEYDPSQNLAFGGGSHQWAIDSPDCPGADCNFFAFRFNVTCSPFDVDGPWEITLAPAAKTDTGMTHEMTATGPVAEAKFDGRPWVASFDIAYCTSDNEAFCDVQNAGFEQNAQTRYHFDVIGFPTEAP